MSVCDILLMDDIEDLIGEDYAPRKPRDVTVRVRRRQKATAARAAADPTPLLAPPICDSVIPGTQTVHVRTWGCTHNGSDSEYMTGLLAQYGYNITDDADSADLWLLNSCTVKSPAEQHFRNEIARGRGLGKHVVVAGCVPQGAPKSDYLQGLSVIGVQQIDRVVEVVEETLKGHTVRLYGQKKKAGRKLGGASLLLPKVRRNPLIEIIPINTGCLNQCTYCKTRHARGQLGSYPVDEIVERARQAFGEGVCELWLTSEDTGAYGRDIDSSLPELLQALLPEIPQHAMMRVGMTNPPYILDHLHEIAEVLRHPRVYAFLHVPVQSGSDSVLADMRREYTVQQFRAVVDHLRSSVPDISICTDIICGFPTETAEDFCETLTLCREYRFPSLFINQFYPRPGTPAARMTRVPTAEVKRRTRLLTELFHSYRPYDHQIGQRHSVLVTELSHDKLFYVGHNKAYQQVLVPMDSGDLMGRRVTVHIESASKFSMTSRLCEDGVGVSACIARSPAAQNQQLSSTSPPAAQNQQLSSTSPPAAQNQQLFSTSPPAAHNQQLSSSSPPAAHNQQLSSISPPAAQNQQLSSTSPPAAQNPQLSSTSPPAALSCWLTDIDLTCALLLALCALSVSYLLVRVADVCTRLM